MNTEQIPTPPSRPQVSSYTEDYTAEGGERTVIDPAVAGPPAHGSPHDPAAPPGGRQRRTWPTSMVVMWSIAALLVGVVLALLLLPEEQAVVLDDQAQAQALAQAQTEIDRLQGLVGERDALIAELQQQLADAAADGDAREQAVAAREAAVAAREAQQDERAGTLDAREADVARREAEVDRREVAVAEREAAVTAREEAQSGGEDGAGIDLPVDLDLPQVDLPDLDLPDERAARGLIERLVDRIGQIFSRE